MSIAAKIRPTFSQSRGGLSSAGIHLVVLLGMLGVFGRGSRIAPYKLPGTAQGVRLLTFYSPGSPEHPVSDIPKKTPVQPTPSSSHSIAAPAAPKETGGPPTETGKGSTAESGLGEGEIRIALQTYFPFPKPNLSSLPHGTKSDVILNAVIDENGKIADLTVLKGLGDPIDDEVIATVKQWTFAPATRNGTPIASEQELHFHYERS
jgi:protein TonB